MRLVQAGPADIIALRERRRRAAAAPEPGFYRRLTAEATPYRVDDDQGRALGHVLLVERKHTGHTHLTVVELYLEPTRTSEYEDLLDLVRGELAPSAYLVRTDDCLLSSALLARGLQVEPVALVMLAGESAGEPAGGLAGGSAGATRGDTAAKPPARARNGLDLVPLGPRQPSEVQKLLEGAAKEGHDYPDPLDELRTLAEAGTSWLLVREGRPVGILARSLAEDGVYALLDYAVADAPEADLVWGLRRATELTRRDGRQAAAVIDVEETVRRRLFRAAGYYTATAFVVFYDAATRRPSVGVLSLAELRAMMDKGEPFHLVDVLGEEHWKDGHLPGAQWIDFRGLAREARKRFRPEETIVVYCSGFT